MKASNKAAAAPSKAKLVAAAAAAASSTPSAIAALSQGVQQMAVSGVGAGAAGTPQALRKTRDPLSEVRTPQSTPSPPAIAPAAVKGGADEITYEEALKRKAERELEDAKLMCSLENKEASPTHSTSVDVSLICGYCRRA